MFLPSETQEGDRFGPPRLNLHMLSFLKVFQLVLRPHVSQRPVRTLLTIFGVALGVAASIAVRTANLDVLRSFEQAVQTVSGPTALEVFGGELGFDETLISKVRQTRGVQSANPVILQTAVKPGDGTGSQALPVLGLDLLGEFE